VDFYHHLKDRQVAWARSQSIAGGHTEADRPWVLKREFRELNLWDPSWWSLIAGREHRWARALTSSQCFAVNLFAPLAADPVLALQVLARLRPDHVMEADTVEVALEFTPPQAPGWLGERGQPTQVDAAFIVRRNGGAIGYLLVEVKLGERKLGTCRGARTPVPGAPAVHRESCRSLARIMAEPESQCWLAETEGRTYWRYLLDQSGPFRFDHLPQGAACPFTGGLYQLMRNRVLAHALVREGGAEWADVALCLHPANDAVDVLDEPVGGTSSAQAAFRALLRSEEGLLDLPPQVLIDAVATASPDLEAWAEWVRDRYQLRSHLPNGNDAFRFEAEADR
jgi:hypothetical protein